MEVSEEDTRDLECDRLSVSSGEEEDTPPTVLVELHDHHCRMVQPKLLLA